ncbi:hypothetical protein-transmembrane prediction [Rhodopirellula baltica SH 1]|uniref:Uncharacterized protein n=1 Tax=Rhodopirellula baltica (strain DSM 10527 / NCIMB 13988 / SH1) TaxID=243090 RepID=Q7UJH5_RHOBA|nr:hypothetical protein-transmembrane prediction [Rhodopirellula baltica SH 1]
MDAVNRRGTEILLVEMLFGIVLLPASFGQSIDPSKHLLANPFFREKSPSPISHAPENPLVFVVGGRLGRRHRGVSKPRRGAANHSVFQWRIPTDVAAAGQFRRQLCTRVFDDRVENPQSPQGSNRPGIRGQKGIRSQKSGSYCERDVFHEEEKCRGQRVSRSFHRLGSGSDLNVVVGSVKVAGLLLRRGTATGHQIVATQNGLSKIADSLDGAFGRRLLSFELLPAFADQFGESQQSVVRPIGLRCRDDWHHG